MKNLIISKAIPLFDEDRRVSHYVIFPHCHSFWHVANILLKENIITKNNQNATLDYLASQGKSFMDKMEFVETQGGFLRKVLNHLEEQRVKYSYILENFHQSAMQLSNYHKADIPSVVTIEQPREWPRLSLLESVKQPLSQVQISSICKSIVKGSDNPELANSVIIDFENGRLIWDQITFLLSHATIGIEVMFDQMVSFVSPLGDRLNATVYIHDNNGSPQAFLKVKKVDGEECFFELSHFSLLFLLDEDIMVMDKDRLKHESSSLGDSEKIHDKDVSRDVGMFTLFDKINSLLFVTTY